MNLQALVKKALSERDEDETFRYYIFADTIQEIEPYISILDPERTNIVITRARGQGQKEKKQEEDVEEKSEEDEVTKKGYKIKWLTTSSVLGPFILGDIKDFIMNEFFLKEIETEEKVMAIIVSGIQGIIYLDPGKMWINHIMEKLETNIAEEVLFALMTIGIQIIREGREGKPIGALFVIGDVDGVYKHSRPLILNPFEGHPPEMRDVKNTENWETIKELAQLDGAMIFDEDGIAQSAGRYLEINWEIYLQSGLGGRHLGAASITKVTDSIAISVSASKSIAIFRNGSMIFRLPVI